MCISNKATCAAHKCQRDFWVPKADAANLTNPDEDVCCEASTCANYKCQRFTITNELTGTEKLIGDGQKQCCKPQFIAEGVNVNVCPPGFDYVQSAQECNDFALSNASPVLENKQFHMGVPFGNVWPKGCFFERMPPRMGVPETMMIAHFFFNDPASANSFAAEANSKLICKVK